MDRELTISEARARLPELVRYVAGKPDAVVRIENRRRGERVVLVSESYLARLEAVAHELRSRNMEPFVVVGSLQSELSEDEIEAALAQLEAEAEQLAREKLARLADRLRGA